MESIFQISQRYNALMELVEDETIDQADVNTALEQVMDDVQTKGENCIVYLHRLDNLEEAAKAEKKKMDAYIKGIQNRKKRMEAAIKNAMENMNTKTILTNRGELKLKKNPPALIIDDPAKIPSKFEKQKIEITLDKTAIKAAIKAGETVEGCHLEQGISVKY
jgi:hypothetical protein